jgi:hypothetical protein
MPANNLSKIFSIYLAEKNVRRFGFLDHGQKSISIIVDYNRIKSPHGHWIKSSTVKDPLFSFRYQCMSNALNLA